MLRSAATALFLLAVACGSLPATGGTIGAPRGGEAAAGPSDPVAPPPSDDAPRTPVAPHVPASPAAREASISPTPSPTPTPTPPPPSRPAPPASRTVVDTGWAPFATVGGVVLRHPAARVERIGFHQSNHDGARQFEVVGSAARPMTMESRDRDTGSRTAADIVADPGGEIRAPVTGTVLRAGTYVLYCDYSDDFAVIEPDDHPGWEVKLLHIDGVRVAKGDRVEAGVTVLAGRPTKLPFRSQVDDHTAEPSWPHVHLEVVDPSIPDRPSDGGC